MVEPCLTAYGEAGGIILAISRRLLLMGLCLLLIILGLAGFRRVPETRLEKGPIVIAMSLGSGAEQMGTAEGIDGRLYGPLTFATNGALTVLADTYHQRLVYFSKGHYHLEPLADAMVEDIAVDAKGRILVADNARMALWVIDQGKMHKVVSIPHDAGYTDALWRTTLGKSGHVFVEWVRFGRGTLSTWLEEYNLRGKKLRTLSASRMALQGFHPQIGSPIASPVKSFQVAPNGDLYVEAAGPSPTRTLAFQIYGPDALLMRQVVVHPPVMLHTSEFLGVNDRGWMYVAANLHDRHHPELLVFSRQGRLIASAPIDPVSLYAATYGRVLPGGAVYLDQSTATRYCLRLYRLKTIGVWRWMGPRV